VEDRRLKTAKTDALLAVQTRKHQAGTHVFSLRASYHPLADTFTLRYTTGAQIPEHYMWFCGAQY
jgi:hypothetical protein